MVFRRRRGAFGRRRFANRNRPRWTADFVSGDPAGGALTQQNILSELDFGTSTGLESECTVLRCILWGTVAVATAAGTSLVSAGLVVGNENVTPTFGATHDPGLVDSLIDDDWMWTGQGLAVYDADAGFVSWGIKEDIRVKRTLKSNEVLRFVASNATGGAAVSVRIYIRILIIIKA